jgi:hypothetical protein
LIDSGELSVVVSAGDSSGAPADASIVTLAGSRVDGCAGAEVPLDDPISGVSSETVALSPMLT